jgi:hypothetical protein
MTMFYKKNVLKIKPRKERALLRRGVVVKRSIIVSTSSLIYESI